MRIIGCDLHARQQTIAMLDTTTGEMTNLLMHEGNQVPEFYSQLPHPMLGIEATGSMHWFLNLMEELGIRMPGRPSRHDSSCRAPQAET